MSNTEPLDQKPADAELYLALMDVEYLSGVLGLQDLKNHVLKRTYQEWLKAVARVNIAVIERTTLHAD